KREGRRHQGSNGRGRRRVRLCQRRDSRGERSGPAAGNTSCTQRSGPLSHCTAPRRQESRGRASIPGAAALGDRTRRAPGQRVRGRSGFAAPVTLDRPGVREVTSRLAVALALALLLCLIVFPVIGLIIRLPPAALWQRLSDPSVTSALKLSM